MSSASRCSWRPGRRYLPEFLPAEIQQYRAAGSRFRFDAVAAVSDSDWQDLPRMIKAWIANHEGDVYRRAREEFDRLIIHEAMQEAEGNRSQAGKILGLSHVTLRAKLRLIVPNHLVPGPLES